MSVLGVLAAARLWSAAVEVKPRSEWNDANAEEGQVQGEGDKYNVHPCRMRVGLVKRSEKAR